MAHSEDIRDVIPPEQATHTLRLAEEAAPECIELLRDLVTIPSPSRGERLACERVMREIAALDHPIEGVVMNHYNEPTVDGRYLDQVRFIKEVGLPPATLSNGSGLTPKRVDALLDMGGLYYLGVNISSLDRERYRQQRGVDQLELVLGVGQRHVADLGHERGSVVQVELHELAHLGIGVSRCLEESPEPLEVDDHGQITGELLQSAGEKGDRLVVPAGPGGHLAGLDVGDEHMFESEGSHSSHNGKQNSHAEGEPSSAVRQ